jgi:hypothetical protein
VHRLKAIACLFFLMAMLYLPGCGNRHYTISWSDEIVYVVVYTNSLKRESEIVYLDQKGNEIESVRLPVQGIFDMERTAVDGREIVMPGRFDRRIVRMKGNELILEESDHYYPYLYKSNGKNEVTIYNSNDMGDFNYMTYEFRENGRVIRSYPFRGFPWSLTMDESKVYVHYLRGSRENEIAHIGIFDFKGNHLRSFPLAISGKVGDMKTVDGKLMIASYFNGKENILDRHLIVIGLDDNMKINYLPLDFPGPNILLITPEEIIVTHDLSDKQSAVSVLDRKTLKVKRKHTFDHWIYRAHVIGNRLYTLHQINYSPEGQINVYDLTTFQRLQTIHLPRKGEMMIQNFIVYRK